MKKHLLLLSTLFSMSLFAKDTLVVEKVGVYGPVAFQNTYVLDSLNNTNAQFDPKSTLSDNAISAFLNSEATDSLSKGTSIQSIENKNTLRVLSFNLRTDRYVNLNVDIKQLANYKLHVDGRATGSNLTLKPGEHNVKLVCLAQENSKDTFNISVVGENLNGVEINSTAKRPYLMKEMLEGERTYSARLSPSGRFLIAYYQNTHADGKSTYKTIITDLKANTTLEKRNEYVDYKWLENKDLIYYTYIDNGNKKITLRNPETLEETVLADHIPNGNITLSPTLDYLILSTTDEGSKPVGSLKKLHDPDDRMAGHRNRTSLWKFDIKTRSMQRLTYGNTRLYLADISNDGKHLLITTSSQIPSRKPFSREAILRMDASTLKVDTLIADTAWLAGAKFSPKADQLLIKACPEAFNRIGSEISDNQTHNAFDYRLFLYNINTKITTPLLPHFNPSVDSYSWNEVNNLIYFTASDGCDRTIYSLNPENKEVRKFDLPLTYVTSFTYATQQKNPIAIIIGQANGERAREMYQVALNHKDTKAKRIGEINFDEMYKDVAIGTCHDWKFQSSRGDSINGFYYLPANFDETKKYPLIVYYYGGCTPSNKLLEINYPYQVFASLGYVVYVVQPSGAIGFGQEFAARHVNTWGDRSSDDIIEGTKQFCKEHTFVNTEKVGCIGASYGGFMTQYLQTKTDLFAAAISHAGISNIASYWGGGYWGYTYGEIAQYGSFPWNNPDLYTKHSSLFNADKINTPLLLLHGTVDTNVPPFESQQLYTALRILGKTVEYIQVDGQDHVITDWNKRLQWQDAIFAWFAKYLKDQPEWWDETSKKW